MTVYVEACESGSVFDGVLPPGLVGSQGFIGV
jgi:hypothetical protein